MKVIGVDNHARESVADILIAENVPDFYANLICELLNTHFNIGDLPGTWFVARLDTYQLWRGMEELV